MIKTKEHNIRLKTIDQSLELYENLHAHISNFGIDIFSPDFKPKDIAMPCDHLIVLLSTNVIAEIRLKPHRFQITSQAYSVHIISPSQIHSFSNTGSNFYINFSLFERSFFSSTPSNKTSLR